MKELRRKDRADHRRRPRPGRTHALALAREGANIVVTDLHERELGPVPYPLAVAEDLAETVRLVEAEGVKALSLTVDVRDADAVDAAARKAVEEFGSLDVVCANAGIWAAAELSEMTEEQWQTVIDINLTGVFHTVRAAAREMKPQNSGADHLHRLDRGPRRDGELRQLRRRQVGRDRAGEDGGDGARPAQDQRQRDLPGLR